MDNASRGERPEWARPGAPATGPVRTCIGCLQRCRDAELLRVVAADRVVLPDPRRVLPGRGAWIHRNDRCMTAAQKRRAFARALKGPTDLDVTPVAQYLGTVPDGRTPTAARGGVREEGNEVDPS